MFDLGEEGRRRGMSAARVGGRPPPFIGPEGGGGAGGFNGRPRRRVHCGRFMAWERGGAAPVA
jgi:hypothetical protein